MKTIIDKEKSKKKKIFDERREEKTFELKKKLEKNGKKKNWEFARKIEGKKMKKNWLGKKKRNWSLIEFWEMKRIKREKKEI